MDTLSPDIWSAFQRGIENRRKFAHPALQRLLLNGFAREWGESERNAASASTGLPLGRKHLEQQAESFARLIDAIALVMEES